MATLREALAIAWQAHEARDFARAEQVYRQILDAAPRHAQTLALLGTTLAAQGKWSESAPALRQAVAVRPDFFEAHVNLGDALYRLERYDEAIAAYRRAIDIRPTSAAAHNNLGTALRQARQFDAAAASFLQALTHDPNLSEPHNNLGCLYTDLGQLNTALLHLERAIGLRPANFEAITNLGVLHLRMGKDVEALAAFDRALVLNPQHPEARAQRAQVWLLAGRFEDGWKEYEWRWRCKDMIPRHFAQPMWDGSPLAGHTILIHAEQGLGDILHFIRYAALAKNENGTIIVECPRPLLPLLSRCPWIDRLVERGATLPTFDVHAPLQSLPRILGTTLANVPASVPYLFADEELVAYWRQRLQALRGFNVGIAWQGNPQGDPYRHRAIPLREFCPLAHIPGVRLISLQKGAGREQLAGLADQLPVLDWSDEMDINTGPFLDTAAVMKSLDLVISSDTSVAHLAGALAVPTWLAISTHHDWRWLRGREDSPWYPTMRLFRQRAYGEWSEVFARISSELRLGIGNQAADS
jgi:tetratricopeptide (TPR) repeat protein